MTTPPDDSFWSAKTADRVATEQGITEPQSLDVLTGAAADLWADDDEFEQFLVAIERHPHEPASA